MQQEGHSVQQRARSSSTKTRAIVAAGAARHTKMAGRLQGAQRKSPKIAYTTYTYMLALAVADQMGM
jgi:hypothetical protein